MANRTKGPGTPRSERREREAAYERQERRARRVNATPEGVAEAVTRQGAQFFGTSLMSRHTSRFRHAMASPELLSGSAWAVASMIPLGDAALTRLSAQWSDVPDAWGQRSWPDILRWGLDRTADGFRLLRLGETFGAAVVARQQLERWTYNVAVHHGIEEVEGETTADYFRRVWAVYPTAAELLDVGAAWIDLSEGLHGRGPLLAAWRAFPVAGGSLAGPVEATDLSGSHDMIVAVLALMTRQVHGGISLAAEEIGLHDLAHAVQGEIEDVTLPVDIDPLRAVAPLDFGVLHSPIMTNVMGGAQAYRDWVMRSSALSRLMVGSARAYANAALVERRGRAAQRGRRAYATEQEMLGEDFEPGNLGARLFRYIAIAEAASLVASWTEGPERDALQTACAALRSGWILWLDDTDLALPCVRTLLEQTCRARAWRVKPRRAARVEGSGANASPARWAEAAGWARLSPMSRALGEFAHIHVRARWSGARDVLRDIQPADTEAPEYTARGFALDSAAYLLAAEVAHRLSMAGAHVEAAFRETVTLLEEDQHDARTDDLLTQSLLLRDRDLGPSDFRPLADLSDEDAAAIYEPDESASSGP